MYAYKYLKKEHLLEFKDRGTICINTLYNLWSEREAIRDEFEGRQRIKVEPKRQPLRFSNKEAHNLFPNIKFSKEVSKNALTVMPKAHVISDKQVQDAFVFCTSLKIDKQLCKKFGYDSYYKINDLDRFAEILFERLNEIKLIMCYKAGEVKYSNKEIITNNKKGLRGFNDFWTICFTKPKKFSNEREYRIVFVPQFSTEIKPVFLDCPELLKYCDF